MALPGTNIKLAGAVTETQWISAGSPIVAVAITFACRWLIGQRVTDRWNQAQKRRELDFTALGDLYKSYGEFYAVWKAWSAYFEAADWSLASSDTLKGLLLRATAAEGSVEALLTKITTERELSDAEIDVLGSLRQAYHELRKAIVRGEPLPWHYSAHSDYAAFKGLQIYVANMLTQRTSSRRPAPPVAARDFTKITSNKYEWTFPQAAVQNEVYFLDGSKATGLDRPVLKKRQTLSVCAHMPPGGAYWLISGRLVAASHFCCSSLRGSSSAWRSTTFH